MPQAALTIAGLIGGIALVWKKQKWGLYLLIAAFALLSFLSVPMVANMLVYPLERNFPPYQPDTSQSIDYIVILGGGIKTGANYAPVHHLSRSSFMRLHYGLLLARHHPEAQIIVSGGNHQDSTLAVGYWMYHAARALGIDSSRLILEVRSLDTPQQAHNLAPRLRGKTAIVVTGATHMYRAHKLFKKQGAVAIAAPSNYHSQKQRSFLGAIIPTPGALYISTRAFYEYFGLLFALFRSTI